MKKLDNIDNFRRVDLFGDGSIGNEYSGAFIIDRHKNGEYYLVIVSNGEGWDHVSITLHRKNGANIKRCPSFEEMQMVKDKVFSEEEVVFQIHPREEDYIDTHPYCLHLWKPNDRSIIVPPLDSISDDVLLEGTYFEYEDIIVRIKIGEKEGWKVARVYCFTKDGRLIKSGPTWDVMCVAKSHVFGEKDAAFQFMTTPSDIKHTSLDIWYPKNLDLMPPLPDPSLVGKDKKTHKNK